MLSWSQVGHILLSLCTHALLLLDCLCRSARRHKTLLLFGLLLLVVTFGLLRLVPTRRILPYRLVIKNSAVAAKRSISLPEQQADSSSFVIKETNNLSHLLHKDNLRHNKVGSFSHLLHKDNLRHKEVDSLSHKDNLRNKEIDIPSYLLHKDNLRHEEVDSLSHKDNLRNKEIDIPSYLLHKDNLRHEEVIYPSHLPHKDNLRHEEVDSLSHLPHNDNLRHEEVINPSHLPHNDNLRHKEVDSPSHKLHKDVDVYTKTLNPVILAMAADKSEPGFDVLKVNQLFSSCTGEDDVISMQCYIDAFQELCKLFRLFGTVFGFVTSDVEEKTAILRTYNQDQPQHYSTVQSMIEFEVSNNLTDNKKKASGTRTLLRLHRAMEFISAFLVKLKDPGNNSKFSAAVSESYDITLAKHHPWLIRKAVQMALYMLPSRPDLLKKMGIKDTESNMQQIGDLVLKLNAIFSVIEKLYAKDDLLQLP